MYDYCNRFEKNIYEDPNGALNNARKALEFIVESLIITYKDSVQEKQGRISEKIKALEKYIDEDSIIDWMHTIRKAGNIGSHDNKNEIINSNKAEEINKILFELMKWFLIIHDKRTINNSYKKVSIERTKTNDDNKKYNKQIQDRDNRIKDIEVKNKDLKLQRDDAIEIIKYKDKIIDKLENKINSLKDEIKMLNIEIGKLYEYVDSQNDEIIDLKEENKKLRQKNRKIKDSKQLETVKESDLNEFENNPEKEDVFGGYESYHDELLNRIRNVIIDKKRIKAREIAKITNIDKSEINRILYQYENIYFKKDDNFRWSLV